MGGILMSHKALVPREVNTSQTLLVSDSRVFVTATEVIQLTLPSAQAATMMDFLTPTNFTISASGFNVTVLGTFHNSPDPSVTIEPYRTTEFRSVRQADGSYRYSVNEWRSRSQFQGDISTYVAQNTASLRGPKGDSPTNAELTTLITPLIPAPVTGPTGVVAATLPIRYDATNKTVSIDAATPSAPGSMSAADKTKLNSLVNYSIAFPGGITSIAVNTMFQPHATKDAEVYITGELAASLITLSNRMTIQISPDNNTANLVDLHFRQILASVGLVAPARETVRVMVPRGCYLRIVSTQLLGTATPTFSYRVQPVN